MKSFYLRHKASTLASLMVLVAVSVAFGVQKSQYTGNGVTVTNTVDTVITSPLESNGAIPINIQDQHSRAFDVFLTQDVGSSTTLTTDVIEDAYTMSATTGHGLIQGDMFILRDSVGQRGWTGIVITVAGDNTVNVDRPISFAFPSASTVVQEVSKDMNVNGAITPVTFKLSSPLLDELDITRIMIQMTTTDVALWDEFGDIASGATFRGIQCRLVNGETADLWNAKTNGELANLMYDIQFFDATHPQAVNGIAGRMTYAGQAKHGVTLRIGAGESLEVIVQDDLSSLLTFHIIVAGHFVTD